MSSSTSTPRVGLYIRTWHSSGRDILAGITRYLQTHRLWEVYSPWPTDGTWHLDDSLQLDGLIMRVDSLENREACQHLADHPRGLVLGEPGMVSRPPDFDWDQASVGRLAGEHLTEQQHRHFAFVGSATLPYQQQRGSAFIEQVGTHVHTIDASETRHDRLHEQLCDWLTTLPKPIGVFAATDPLARSVVEAAKHRDIEIPGEVAVVGAGDDQTFCELTSPPLSSVGLPGLELGYRAAEWLDRMMLEGVGKPRVTQKARATYVAHRSSTDTFAIDDVAVSRALRYIRDHAGEPIDLEAVVDSSGVSRRTLELRFKSLLGRSPQREVWRAHVQRACRLLISTDMPLADVADRSGFTNPQRFAEVFKRETGMTAGAYRSSHHPG